jgi:hypothetical protein
MRRGDFEAAWRETDRIELPRRLAEPRGEFVREPHHLTWDGSPFDGQRVLVRCEHGLGDSIQFLRYAPLLRARARHVAVKVPPALLPLFAGMDGIDTLLDAWTAEPEPEHDVAIECMELAYAFRHTAADLPARVPYLPVERIAAEARPLSLPTASGLKIGLVWAASAWDPSRSLALRQLAPLGRVKGVDFFSLQQGPELAELDSAPFPIFPLSRQTTGIREAAAAMLAMDLILTVDGMTAHLAGALGRPVWISLSHQADWRWMTERADSPWYPTMRLFRQRRPGDWERVIADAAAALASFSGLSGVPR